MNDNELIQSQIFYDGEAPIDYEKIEKARQRRQKAKEELKSLEYLD